MSMDRLRVDPPLCHQGPRSFDGAIAPAANAEHINIIHDQLGCIEGHRWLAKAVKQIRPPRLTMSAASLRPFGAPEHSMT